MPRSLHESLLMPVVICGSETMMWNENERSRIRSVQMANLRGLIGIRRIECTNKGVLRVFSGGSVIWRE